MILSIGVYVRLPFFHPVYGSVSINVSCMPVENAKSLNVGS